MYLIGKRGEERFLCAEDAQRGSGLASLEMTEKGLGLDPGGLLLIGGRKFAELGDGGGDHVQSEINIGGSGVAAETEAQAGARFFRGPAEPHDASDVFCAGAESTLVMTSVEKLTQTRSAADVKSADSLGRIQLVAREGEQIDLERVDIDGDFSCGLHGVGVEVDVSFLGDAADFLERLDGAKFIVGVHDGGEHRFRADRAANVSKINLTIGVRCKVGYASALFFESLASIQDGFVLDGGGDDVRRRDCIS